MYVQLIFRSMNFSYFKNCILEKVTDACTYAIHYNSVVIYSLSVD